MLADQNGNSIKVAKYAGTDRIDLIENEEYGYCCLVKAAKAVLDKIKVENRTFAQITSTTRKQKQMLNEIAVHEAVINAIVHNNYTGKTPTKFEFFSDRLEITSTGSLPEGMNEDDFFSGISYPQNKVLMRVFRDLDMVEHLGSGVPRILQFYPKTSYVFLSNFTRVVFPYAEGFTTTDQVTPQATGQATQQDNRFDELLKYCQIPRSTKEMMSFLQLKHRESFRDNWIVPLLEAGLLTMTLPDKPSSPKQKYQAMRADNWTWKSNRKTLKIVWISFNTYSDGIW